MRDAICLVTGASSGLGFSMALGLAKTGATIVMLCRDKKRGHNARIRLIAKSGNPNIDLMLCDLSLMDEVHQFVEEFNAFYPRLDILANIAGMQYPNWEKTAEGNELNLAVNVLGPFLLTTLLLEKMKDSGSATIINVSGESHRDGFLHLDDLHLHDRFHLKAASDQVALARVIWTYELAHRLTGTGITANTFCPGWSSTNLERNSNPIKRWSNQLISQLFARKPEESIQPVLDFTLNEARSGATGFYLRDGRPAKSLPVTYRPRMGRRLWQSLEELTGCKGITREVVNEMMAFEF